VRPRRPLRLLDASRREVEAAPVLPGRGRLLEYETCAPGSTFFQESLRAPDSPKLPERGILDLGNPSNPFRDFSIVYIPYCTGDVHWGNNVQRYSDGNGHMLTIHHVGFDNDRRVLAWTYRRYAAAKQVFVTGCSAGSVGSAVFAPYVIRRYPHAVVNQFGDSLAFVLPRPVNMVEGYRADRNLPRWIPAMRRFDASRMTMAQYYSIVANYDRATSLCAVRLQRGCHPDALLRRARRPELGLPTGAGPEPRRDPAQCAQLPLVRRAGQRALGPAAAAVLYDGVQAVRSRAG
jgi:hypothetical protein